MIQQLPVLARLAHVYEAFKRTYKLPGYRRSSAYVIQGQLALRER